MESISNFYFHFFPPQFRIAVAFILAILFNLYAIPVIIRIARAKKLFDDPGERKSHSTSVPTLGGLGIYATITAISLTFINTCGLNGGGVANSLNSLPPIIAGFTLIFFIGMKDDMLNISAWKKLIVEFAALIMLIVIGDVRLDSMQGMFSITEISYFASLLLSIFAGIVIINSFNLIDGIDGLAASIAMLVSLVFGFYFLAAYEWEYAVLSFIVLGSLIPFFLYNAFGFRNKIFMGDTGSLILGFIVTVLVFRFNEMNGISSITPHFAAGPAFSFAVLIIPMFDTLRVFAIRVFRGGSPFKADQRHIHHILIDLGFTHLQSTLILVLFNIAFISFAYFFNYLGNSMLMYIMIPAAIIFSLIAILLRRKKNLAKMEMQTGANVGKRMEAGIS
jgi:UDP-N-acetylmuramyl pentapeptide phosphotransferase/UDP-N-acetylglucosamine-1-phosphate transferase